MNLVGYRLDASPVCRNRDIGDFRVQLCPVTHQLDQLLLRVGVIEQRPVAPVPRALELLADRGLEIDHGAAFGEHAPIVDVDHRAAARGDHHARKTREALDGLPFTQPEACLALFFEDESDVNARAGLDVGVAVVEGESQGGPCSAAPVESTTFKT